MVSHDEIRKLAIVLAVFAIPAWSDPALFERIHKRNVIRIVLPTGECEARVVTRGPDGLTAKLKSTTSVCGQAKTLVTLSRSNLQDVVDNNPRKRYGARSSPGGACAGIAISLAVPAAVAAGILTRNFWAFLAISGGGGVAGAILCNKETNYTIFIDQLGPAQP